MASGGFGNKPRAGSARDILGDATCLRMFKHIHGKRRNPSSPNLVSLESMLLSYEEYNKRPNNEKKIVHTFMERTVYNNKNTPVANGGEEEEEEAKERDQEKENEVNGVSTVEEFGGMESD